MEHTPNTCMTLIDGGDSDAIPERILAQLRRFVVEGDLRDRDFSRMDLGVDGEGDEVADSLTVHLRNSKAGRRLVPVLGAKAPFTILFSLTLCQSLKFYQIAGFWVFIPAIDVESLIPAIASYHPTENFIDNRLGEQTCSNDEQTLWVPKEIGCDVGGGLGGDCSGGAAIV